MSKRFRNLFSRGHEIQMKYEKCIVDISYFEMCFAKTLAKYPRNAKYTKMAAKCEKRKVYSGVFCVIFFTFCAPFFVHFASGSAFTRKFKGFCGLFFRGINKTQNSHKMGEYIVSVSHFVVCFAKTLAKCEKCIAGLMVYFLEFFFLKKKVLFPHP